jgi:cytochrome c peroxidase
VQKLIRYILAAGMMLMAGIVLTLWLSRTPAPSWEAENPLRPLPASPLGVPKQLSTLAEPPTPERVRLGRWLFFDKRLSRDGTVSCASCHQPSAGFADIRAVSPGIGGAMGTRKAPPVMNLAFAIFPRFFWDGRTNSLEAQALGPITNPVEMGMSHDAMIAAVAGVKGYKPYFRESFGDETITPDRIAKAIADYERTLLTGNSPWDRWRAGDESAVSEQVKKGHQLFFFGAARCNQCHLGPDFSDFQFHNLGIGWDAAAGTFRDEGRALVTKKDADRGAFRTPPLRNVALRAPYMHDGSLRTLKEVMRLYNQGGHENPYLSSRIEPLDLSDDDLNALVALMEAFTGTTELDPGPRTFPQ